MIAEPASPVCRKPVGGVAAVELSAVANVRDFEFDDDGSLCRLLIFADDNAVMRCRLIEERSSFVESLSVEGGAVSVLHTLRLVADRNMAERCLEPDFIGELVCGGAVAAVTLADGRRFAVGLSRRFGSEQPLRLRTLKADSGCRAVDEPTLEMVLESADTSFAALCPE